MEFHSARSDYKSGQDFKGKGRDNVLEKGMPPGFSNPSRVSTTRLDPFRTLGGSNALNGGASAASSAVSDVGSFSSIGTTKLNSLKDDFDSFLDDAAPETAPSSAIPQASDGRPTALTGATIEGLFLPYLPQDDAVAAGLGAKEGGIDASEAQEVVDHLNQQLASLLRCSPPEFWKKVAMDETLDTFIDSYLHFRRRWYDGRPFANSSGQTAGVIVGDGDLSRRVFMLLYRMSSNQDPGVPASQSLSAKEHAALLKEWKLLDLPKLLDVCAVYDHDNHELTSRLVSNVFRAQPSFGDDLAVMVCPILRKIDTMHQRCCTIFHSLQESEVDAVKEQLTEVVEYLNDVIITLDSFIGAYPPAASILILAGNTRNGIGMFLPALGAIYDSMIPVLSAGFTALGNPRPSSHEKEDTEVAAQLQLKRLKTRIVDFAWDVLRACFLGKKEKEVASLSDFPSLGASVESIKIVEDPAVKGDLLVQAAVAMTTGLSERDVEGTLVSLSANSETLNMGALLRSIEKRHGLCETVHELCQSGSLIMDDTQYEYFLSLISRGHASKVSNPYKQLSTEDKVQDDDAIMLQSKISQVKDLFPDYGDGFVALCLEAYDNDPEKVISCILEDRLHADLASLDVTLAAKPSKKVEAPRDKGKGKVSDESRTVDKGKGVFGFEAGDTSARLSSLSLDGNAASGGREGSSSGRQPPGFAPEYDYAKVQPAATNQGRFVRRGKEGGTFNQLINRREKDSAFSATVRAGKQYEYEDEYDDSFDDLAGTYLADVGEEETENLADRVKRHSVPRSGPDEGSDWRPSSKPAPARGGLPQTVPRGADQNSDRRYDRQQEPLKGSGTGLLPSPSDSNYTPSGHAGRGGHSSGRGGHYSTGQSAQRWKDPEGRKYAPVAPETGSSARVGPSPQATTEENVSTASGGPSDRGRTPAPQGGPGAARGGKSRRGKGKVEPAANFYLKDGKLYSYKVAGAEASFASVEEYEASQIQEEETIFGLGAGGNIPAANVEERDSPGNLAQVPAGRGAGGRGRGGPAGRGRYPSKNYDNHRRKDQSMKKHFAGLGGL